MVLKSASVSKNFCNLADGLGIQDWAWPVLRIDGNHFPPPIPIKLKVAMLGKVDCNGEMQAALWT